MVIRIIPILIFQISADLPGFSKTALLISHFWRSPLALKDSQLYKDAKYAITWKKVITRVTWFFH